MQNKHLENIVKLSQKMIAINSIEGNQKELDEVLETACSAVTTGMRVDFEKDGSRSVLFHNKAEMPERFHLLLNGHIDVVPGNPEQFLPTIDGDKLIGRGASDMKSAVAVLIEVFNEMAQKVDYPLGLQIVTDEETSGYKGTGYQVNNGIKSDIVIAGEGTDLDIAYTAKGIVWIDLLIKGSTGHGAYPWQGKNAIFNAMEIVKNISTDFPVPASEQWVTTVNLAKLNTSNPSYNKIPDATTLSLDIRYVPNDSIMGKGEQGVREYFAKMANVESVKILEYEPSHYVDPNNLYLQKLHQTIKKVGGHEAKLIQKNGGSDIRHYTDPSTCGMVFGPIGKGLHTDFEWVSIESLGRFYEILCEYCREID